MVLVRLVKWRVLILIVCLGRGVVCAEQLLPHRRHGD